MKRWRAWKKLGALLTIGFFLAACGGGGSTTPIQQAEGGVGIAVDPYIVGAVFEEKDAAGNTIQRSTPSDEDGRFTFDKPFASGSSLVMVEKGLHNGLPFNGTLKRKVNASGVLVTSPLTTLVAEGVSEEAAAEMLEIEVAELYQDPMVYAGQGDNRLLVAAMAVNTALTILDNKVENLSLIENTVKSVAAFIEKVLDDASGSSQAKIGAGVAAADFIVNQVKTEEKDLTAAIEKVGEKVAELIEKAEENNGVVAVEVGDDGEIVIDKPDTSLAGYLAKAFEAFDKGTINNSTDHLIDAAAYFKHALALASGDTSATQSDKDVAYFFGAFARVLSLANPYSTAVDGNFNTLGDLLDAFGFEKGNDLRKDFSTISYPQECFDNDFGWEECKNLPLPADSPTSGEVQAFLFDKLTVELNAAISDFNKVSTGFTYSWTDPVTDAVTEFDYADLLFTRGLAKAMLFQLHVQEAYDMDVDIAAEEQDFNQEEEYTIEDFLTNNPTLGSLKDASKLAEAKVFATGTLDDWLAALDRVEGSLDERQNHFIDFTAEECYWDNQAWWYVCEPSQEKTEENLARLKEDLAAAKDSLNEAIVTNEGRIVDFSQFFKGIDLRDQLPAYEGSVPGLFPDPTLGGILVEGFDINADLDEDGSPDLLMGLTQFSEKMLDDRDFYVGGWCGVYGELSLSSEGTFSFDVQIWPTWTTVTGTWSVEDGKLFLDGDNDYSLQASLAEGDGRQDGWLFLDVFWSQTFNQQSLECFGYFSSHPDGFASSSP
ncbi:hypothetical protein [Geoalkalibacter halelectricus]|uniref:PA14 domain-containing protein n=1 Tax=Geoalkalibacter halelectricus TaxID=2847045 RepID=A0ABY5ZQF3_9BACT|nr:hypothetical protein [Geoalkalibacter halelectricus]MDO3377611.1 hypothetical protein [Geoalkalibacter halelectricus]UWZ81402.1 hypothetical protein L9S41_08405 [Geoalkalibacter halelectricus]